MVGREGNVRRRGDEGGEKEEGRGGGVDGLVKVERKEVELMVE